MDRRLKDPLPQQLSLVSLQRLSEQAQRQGNLFLKGPIPLVWLQKAASLPGKALEVALAIQVMRGLSGRNTDIAVTDKLVQRIAVMDRNTRYRAVCALEKGGLIRVVRQRGKAPRVAILDLEGNSQIT